MKDAISNIDPTPARKKNVLSGVSHSEFVLRYVLILLLSLSASLVPLDGDWHAETEVLDVVVFKDPKVTKRPKIRYPKRQLSKGEEGWVRLQAMINLEGAPYDIIVTDSVGDEAFETAAIQALKRTTFQPGEQNGEKVESNYWWQVTFEMEDKVALYHGAFRQRFFDVVNMISEDKKNSAESGLESLAEARKTLYEDAMYWTAKYYFDQVWGTPSQQLSSVSKALGYDENRRYMDANLYQKLRWSKFHLQIDLKRYADALTTLSKFVKMDGIDEAMRTQAIEYKSAIDALAAEGTAYAIDAAIDQHGRWYYTLLRNHFGVTDVEGLVDEFTVYCQRDRFRLKYEPDFEYKLDGTNGVCSVAVVGDPGTSFRLIQL